MRKISLKKFWNRLSKKQKIILVSVILALIAGGAYFFLRGSSDIEGSNTEQPPEPVYSQLMGIPVEEDVAKRPILGVMIENHPESRPQTGLSSAGIVFETVAEGGITRYLTMFQENMPDELGPVRSVRAYYLDWVMGFDASIAHVGGSADALELIDRRSAKSLTQFRYPEPYRRISSRSAPHNMYATTADLRELQEDLGHKTSDFDPIPRSEDNPAAEPDASKISLNFSGPDYAVEYRYQPESNDYVRYLAGKPDIDAATNKPIIVKNVVAIRTTTSSIRATGSGKAYLFKDGTVSSINWKQSSFRDRIVLTDANKNEVALNRGNTWFAVLPYSGSIKY